jgi:outer membrane protein assembly factor BamD (BamD/ComL family)
MWQQQRQNFNQLAQSLKSGNLDAAKQAFSALSSNSTNVSNPNSPLAKLGAALQTGDMNAAQQAFAALRTGHHHHGDNSQAQSTPAMPLATSGSVGTQLNTVA